MLLENIIVGPLECNCIILSCEKTKEAVVIDPGDEANRILRFINQHNLCVKHIIQTHAHVDHIGGAKALKDATEAEILLHQDDLWLFENLQMQAFMFGLEIEPPSKIDRFIQEDDKIAFGSYKMRVIHTPGHSPGSVCFYMSFSLRRDEQHILLSGDTLFWRGFGRTDLWGSSTEKILESIRAKLFVLPDDTIVYPGHGPMTTIGEEKRDNPFL